MFQIKLASERRKKQEEMESKKDSQPTKITGVLPSSEEKPATYRRGVGKYVPSTVTSPSQEQRYSTEEKIQFWNKLAVTFHLLPFIQELS